MVRGRSCLACGPDTSAASSIGDCEGADGAEDHACRERRVGESATDGGEQGVDGGTFSMTDLQEAITADATSPIASTVQEVHSDSRGRRFEDSRDNLYNAPNDDGGCVSCSISLPEDTLCQLPVGAPGSPKKNGGRNGSPKMRTTERFCEHRSQQQGEVETEAEGKFQESPGYFASDASATLYPPHEVIYWTTSSPVRPDTYSILRRATIRTLSCEQLPRGLTCGALSFADPVDGYTVAYKFRLPDPYARGSQRYYALIALVGKSPTIMCKSTPIIWRAFRRIAAGIMARTENVILQGKTAENDRGGRKSLMPGSSFLTGRTVDPDGCPRRNCGFNMRARGLAEMVGDELIFAHVHGEFTYLLQNLGRQFGLKAPVVDSNIENRYHENQTGVPYRSP